METNLNKIVNFFKKRNSQSIIEPMRTIKVVERPVQPVNRLSEEQYVKLKIESEETKKRYSTVDKYFIQEISDRLYGPESDNYIDALKELNKKFKPRVGRTGADIFKN
jgi:hypothetical protein